MMRVFPAALSAAAIAGLLLGVVPAQAEGPPGTAPGLASDHQGVDLNASASSLAPFYSDVGNISLSLDATGTNDAAATVEVAKPAGALVRRAFLFAASTGFLGYNPPDGSVTLDGTPMTWDPAHTIASAINSWNVVSDVTDVVSSKLHAAAPGNVSFEVKETNTTRMDGEVLAVIWTVPSGVQRSVALFYGSQNTAGDSFKVTLSEPLKASSKATMSLGISYGYQTPSTGVQFSTVDINGQRLTSTAGGQDDGVGTNGGLITVGGVGDDPANPADPNGSASCGVAPRCDDELYDLKAVVPAGSTSFAVSTKNPSNDDNMFLAVFDVTGVQAAIGESVVVSPGDARQQINTLRKVYARAQNAEGQIITDKPVTFAVTDGPNAGAAVTTTQLPDGRWKGTWTSTTTGRDTVKATFDGSSGTVTSNAAYQTWAPTVAGTFGGEWLYDDVLLSLHYSYAGKYDANITTAASNWTASATKVLVTKWSDEGQGIQLPLVDVNRADTWWAMTIFGEGCWTCGYTSNMVAFNTRTLDPVTADQRNKVATHEIGHALGLRHPQDYGVANTVPSLMWQGNLSAVVKGTPQTLDTDRVNGMYP